MLITYSFLNILYSSGQREQDWGSNKNTNLLSLENYVSRSELRANGKITIALLTLYFQYKKWYIAYLLKNVINGKLLAHTKKIITENVIFHNLYMSKFVQ